MGEVVNFTATGSKSTRVGISFSCWQFPLAVSKVVGGIAATRSGIEEGDTCLAINGSDVQGLTHAAFSNEMARRPLRLVIKKQDVSSGGMGDVNDGELPPDCFGAPLQSCQHLVPWKECKMCWCQHDRRRHFCEQCNLAPPVDPVVPETPCDADPHSVRTTQPHMRRACVDFVKEYLNVRRHPPEGKQVVAAVATNALWTRHRFAEAGYSVDDVKCERCGAEDDTRHHRLWRCQDPECIKVRHRATKWCGGKKDHPDGQGGHA